MLKKAARPRVAAARLSRAVVRHSIGGEQKQSG